MSGGGVNRPLVRRRVAVGGGRGARLGCRGAKLGQLSQHGPRQRRLRRRRLLRRHVLGRGGVGLACACPRDGSRRRGLCGGGGDPCPAHLLWPHVLRLPLPPFRPFCRREVRRHRTPARKGKLWVAARPPATASVSSREDEEDDGHRNPRHHQQLGRSLAGGIMLGSVRGELSCRGGAACAHDPWRGAKAGGGEALGVRARGLREQPEQVHPRTVGDPNPETRTRRGSAHSLLGAAPGPATSLPFPFSSFYMTNVALVFFLFPSAAIRPYLPTLSGERRAWCCGWRGAAAAPAWCAGWWMEAAGKERVSKTRDDN